MAWEVSTPAQPGQSIFQLFSKQTLCLFSFRFEKFFVYNFEHFIERILGGLGIASEESVWAVNQTRFYLSRESGCFTLKYSSMLFLLFEESDALSTEGELNTSESLE